MKKALAPEVALLVPDGIEKFIPHCAVCAKDIPLARSRGKSKHTCSPECQIVWRLFNKHLVQMRKCIACLHPSTPDERADFLEWRRHRGDVRRKRGRPPTEKSLDKSTSICGSADTTSESARS